MPGPKPDQSLGPDALLAAEELHALYRRGLFPMAEPTARGSRLYWYDPDPRALLPLSVEAGLHIPRRLARTLRQARYRVTTDEAFDDVVAMCGHPSRDGAWIDEQIRVIAALLHRAGHAHSIEAWDSHGALVGGLYGVCVPGRDGPVFCAESMVTDFERGTDAGKVCLMQLVELLRKHGYSACDVQLANPHTERFGVYEVARSDYHALLAPESSDRPCAWGPVVS